jgi:TRAP-type mannitol/chloroaromatic compound transport system permease small subunit
LQILLQIAFWIDTLNEYIGRLTYWLTLVMVGVGAWNVLGRYIGQGIGQNLSSNALIEIQWYLFDLLFLFGAAYTLKHDEHVRVDLLQSRFTAKQKAVVDLLGTVLFLLPFCTAIVVYSWGAIANSWEIREMSPDPGGLPRYPIKSAILVCFLLLILQGISQAIKNIAVLTGDWQAPVEPGQREI